MKAALRSSLLVSLITFGIAGCGALVEGPNNRCETDAECSGATCDVELGMCVARPTETIRIGIEVLPATDPFFSNRSRVSFGPFDLDDISDQPLPLPVGVRVSGILRDELTGEPITADVTFSHTNPIPGRPPIVTVVETSDATFDDMGVDVNFTTQLLPERVYDIFIQPSGEWRGSLPPIAVGSIETPASGTRHLDAELAVYHQPCSVEELRSFRTAIAAGEPLPEDTCLAVREGVIVDSERVAADGLSVRIVSTGGQVMSSSYVTGADMEAEPGAFRVALTREGWLAADGWLFEVSPTTARLEALGPEPIFLVDPAGLVEGDDLSVTILAPASSRIVTYSGSVEAGSEFPPASLLFTSRNIVDEETGYVGSFQASAVNDPANNGAFEVRLLPGTYDVLVTPTDLEGEFGVLRQEITIMPSGDPMPGEDFRISGMSFQVPIRTPVSGRIETVDTDGDGIAEVMENAEVSANTLGADPDGTLGTVARYARSSGTLTDAQGRYALRLDIGAYDVIVQPPVGTNYPWTIRLDLEIGGSGRSIPVDLQLNHPVPVTGVAELVGPTGSIPVAEGSVQAFAIVETSSGFRAVLIGETTTDADGAYTLLLPPSL